MYISWLFVIFFLAGRALFIKLSILNHNLLSRGNAKLINLLSYHLSRQWRLFGSAHLLSNNAWSYRGPMLSISPRGISQGNGGYLAEQKVSPITCDRLYGTNATKISDLTCQTFKMNSFYKAKKWFIPFPNSYKEVMYVSHVPSGFRDDIWSNST